MAARVTRHMTSAEIAIIFSKRELYSYYSYMIIARSFVNTATHLGLVITKVVAVSLVSREDGRFAL